MKILRILPLCAALSACVTTNEMPLAPNMVRLDTHAQGRLFTAAAGNVTLQRAAELTLKAGYSHFRFEQAQTAQGSQLVGAIANSTTSVYGSPYYASGFSTGYATPIYAPTADVGVTVIMFHANEAGAKGAFDAKEVLARLTGA